MKRISATYKSLAWHHRIHLLLLCAYLLARSKTIERRKAQAWHIIGDRRKASPRMVFLVPYVFILYTVTATSLLIAKVNMQAGMLSFSAFVVPLYFMVSKATPRRILQNFQV